MPFTPLTKMYITAAEIHMTKEEKKHIKEEIQRRYLANRKLYHFKPHGPSGLSVTTIEMEVIHEFTKKKLIDYLSL